MCACTARSRETSDCALPATVKKIAVLDRTKEAGALVNRSTRIGERCFRGDG
jgi:hypothetical protein